MRNTKKKEQRQKLDAALDAIRMKFGNEQDHPRQHYEQQHRHGRKAKAQMENETQKRNKN